MQTMNASSCLRKIIKKSYVARWPKNSHPQTYIRHYRRLPEYFFYHIQNPRTQHEPYKNVLLPTKPRGLQMHLLPARPTLRIRKAPSTTQSSTKRQPAHRPLQYKIHGTGCRRTHLHTLSGLVWRYAGADGGADEQRHGNADTRSRSGEGYDV